MQLVCDKNFIQQLYHENDKHVKKEDLLIITFPLLEEIFSTESWVKTPLYTIELLKLIRSSKHKIRQLSFSDLLLNKMGYTALSRDGNFEFTDKLIDGLISNYDKTKEIILSNISRVTRLERDFVPSINDFLQEIKIYKKQNKISIGIKRYFELEDHKYREMLDALAEDLLWRMSKMNLKLKQKEKLPIDALNLKKENFDVKYLSAYFKIVLEGMPALNDQHDYKYLYYLWNENEMIASKDKLIKRILNEVNELNRLYFY